MMLTCRGAIYIYSRMRRNRGASSIPTFCSTKTYQAQRRVLPRPVVQELQQIWVVIQFQHLEAHRAHGLGEHVYDAVDPRAVEFLWIEVQVHFEIIGPASTVPTICFLETNAMRKMQKSDIKLGRRRRLTLGTCTLGSE